MSARLRLILTASFFTGLAALIYEVAATKALFYFFNESTYSAATVIAVFLFGLALGGLGCGLTLGTIATNSKVARMDTVELNPVMPKAAEYFRAFNGNVLENPKVNLVIDDGARYIANTDRRYDLVAVDVENPAVAFSSPLYTLEFFENVRRALKDDGLFTLWAYRRSDEFFAIIYRTLARVFPNVYMRTSGAYQDSYFFATSRKVEPKTFKLSADDLSRLERIKALTEAPINTLDHQVLSRQWAKEYKGL